MYEFILTTILIFLIILMCVCDVYVPPRFPKGPLRYPFFGHYLLVHNLKSRLRYYHLVWDSIAKTYGNIISVKLGENNAVIVSGYDAVRHVLRSSDYEGRPDGFFFRFRALNQRLGVAFVDGSMWSEQKKFFVKYLRGINYEETNKLIKNEVADLVFNIMQKSEKNQSVVVNNLFDVSVLNGLWSILTGRRFELNDPKIIKLMSMVHISFKMLDMSGDLLNNMPFLRYLTSNQTRYTDLKCILDEFYTFLKELVEEHKSTPNDEDDFISRFLAEIDRSREEGSSGSFQEDQLLVVLFDLFLAGSETMSSTLTFTILHLLKHRHVQVKVYEEILSVIGDREIEIVDKRDLKYLEAVLMEVQRISNVAPMGVAHRTLRKTKLSGYIIPADTLVMPSIWSVHMDEKHWGDPEVFRPERFIDGDGEIINDAWFIPFGLGRRKCLGDDLAKTNMFMFIARLVQTFDMQIPEGVQLPVMHQDVGATISPGSFSANFILRNNKLVN